MTPSPARCLAFWREASATRRWRLGLGAAATALAVCMLLLPKPWAISENEKWSAHEYLQVYGWLAAAGNVLILAGLAVLCPWWSKDALPATEAPRPRAPWWFAPLILAAMTVTFLNALPRMNQGFWDDEDLNVRTTLFGKFKESKGERRFQRLDWVETAFGYKKGPNSHTLFGLFSRACEEAWLAVRKPAGFPLVEWPFRLPALIAGVCAVGTLAWLLKEAGLPGTGVLAAFLLAVHPWHIRYASEARGYSLVLAILPLAILTCHRALTTGRWKLWAGFALAEFALLYSYPGTLVILVILNLAAIGFIAFAKAAPRPRAAHAGRWFCANSLSAALTLQLMLPLYPQAKAYFDFVSSQGFTAGLGWARNTVCFMIAGAPWSKSGDPSAGYPELLAWHLSSPVGFLIAAALAVFLILLGVARLARAGWMTSVLVSATFLAPPITFLLAHSKKLLLYESYIITSLPGMAACAAAGIAAVSSALGRLPQGRILAPVCATAFVAAFALATRPTREWIRLHPLQQMRESVLLCRGTLDPDAKEARRVLTASFCIPPYLYDASMDRLDSAAEMVEEIRRADREERPLYVNVGMPWAAREYSPRMWDLFCDPSLFEKPVRLYGFEPSLDRLIARYKPHSADNQDLNPRGGGER